MAFTHHFISFFLNSTPDEQKEQEENTGQFTLLLPFMKECLFAGFQLGLTNLHDISDFSRFFSKFPVFFPLFLKYDGFDITHANLLSFV